MARLHLRYAQHGYELHSWPLLFAECIAIPKCSQQLSFERSDIERWHQSFGRGHSFEKCFRCCACKPAGMKLSLNREASFIDFALGGLRHRIDLCRGESSQLEFTVFRRLLTRSRQPQAIAGAAQSGMPSS